MRSMMPTTQAEDAIVECLAQAAQSDSPAARDDALATLAALTKLSSHNRDLVAACPQAVPLLLSLSCSDDYPLPQSLSLSLSLSVLLHLSLNPALKPYLAAAPGLVPLLNSLLLLRPSAPPHVARLAASLVCSLAMHDKNKAPFGVAGTVDAIVQALRCTPAGHHLLSSLAELVQFHGNCTLAIRAGAVPVLVGIFESPAEDLAAASVGVLARLARFKEGVRAIGEVEGVAGLMVDGLTKGCMESRESAMEVLVRLFEESSEFMREAAAREELSSLLADFSIRGSTKVREKAGLLMKMMEESDMDWHEQGKPMTTAS